MQEKIIWTVWLLVFIFSNLCFAQVNTERYRMDSDSGFTGLIDINAMAQTGNTDFQLIEIGARLNYNRGAGYSFLVVSGGYGWNEGKQFSNDFFSHLRNVESLNDWLQFEAFLQFDYNRKRKLLSRELAGAGLRYKVFTSDIIRVRTGTSYFFEAEQYDLSDEDIHDRDLTAHRLSSYLTIETDFNDKVGFLSVSYYQPNLEYFSDLKLISENSLIIKISELLRFNVNYNLRYDAIPPDGIKDLDTITKVGITLRL